MGKKAGVLADSGRPRVGTGGFAALKHDEFPSSIKKSAAGYDGLAPMMDQLELARQQFKMDNGRNWSPSEELLERHEILFRRQFGASPADLIRGEVGGQKIKSARIQLCDPEHVAGPDTFQMEVELTAESAVRTHSVTSGAGSAGDKSLVKSSWDTMMHGDSAGVVSPPMLEQMLVTRSRSLGMALPWMRQGFAPDLTYEALVWTNNVVTELFSGTDYPTLSGSVLPRLEGEAGSFEIRPKFDNYQHSVRGYMGHTSASYEALTSRGGIVTGAWQKAIEMLQQALGFIDEYDFINGLWQAFEVGYVRRFLAAGSWAQATAEIPRGKASVISSNAKKHVAWFDLTNGKFYQPATGATTYYRWDGATEFPTGIFPTTGNKILEILYMIGYMQDRKFRGYEAASLPTDLLTALGLDERMSNTDFIWAPPDLRLIGEPGYVGSIPLVGYGNIAIFKYQPGSVPTFSTTTEAKSVDYLVWGGELGKALTYDVLWAPTIQLDKEYTVKTVDGASRTRPTNQNVATAYSMAGVEAEDMESISLIKCVRP